jgi:hypothetical protein
MILPHVAELARTKRIILASASPRRKELLANIGLRFEARARPRAAHLPPPRLPCTGPPTHPNKTLSRQSPPAGGALHL